MFAVSKSFFNIGTAVWGVSGIFAIILDFKIRQVAAVCVQVELVKPVYRSRYNGFFDYKNYLPC